MTSTCRVSIIVPAWNDAEALSRSLPALFRIDYPAHLVKLVIVGGGTDGTFETALKLTADAPFSTEIVRQQPFGKNAAIRAGLRRINRRSDLIILLDADTLVSRTWLLRGLSPVPRDAAAWGVNYAPARDTPVAGYYLIEKVISRRITREYGLNGGCIFLRAAIRPVHGNKALFSSDVKVGIDYALARVLRGRGNVIGYAKDARVTTPLPVNFASFLKTELRWLRGYTLIAPSSQVRRMALSASTSIASLLLAPLAFGLGAHWIAAALALPFLAAIAKDARRAARAMRAAPAEISTAACVVYPVLRFCHRALLLNALLMKSLRRDLPLTFRGPR